MLDLTRLTREIEARNRRRAQDLAAARFLPSPAERNLGLAHVPGDRVLDLVTGEKGVVIGGTIEHVIVPTA